MARDLLLLLSVVAAVYGVILAAGLLFGPWVTAGVAVLVCLAVIRLVEVLLGF